VPQRGRGRQKDLLSPKEPTINFDAFVFEPAGVSLNPKTKKQQLRDHAETIFRAAVAAVDPAVAVRNSLRLVDRTRLRLLDVETPLPSGRILVIGAGKAAAPMARAVEEILGSRISEGLIVTKDGHGLPLNHIQLREAAHPVPDRRGEQATRQILELVDKATADDLVITLLSGGGSALLAAPAEGLSLADKVITTDLLLASGADIGSINCVRKHLSAVKGGQLARRAAPAAMLTLVISDVIGDPLDVIASGPTVPDPTRYVEAEEILRGCEILHRCPRTVRDHLRAGRIGQRKETPKPDEVPTNGRTRIIAGNASALQAARRKAEELGYDCRVVDHRLCGEAREAARQLAAAASRPVRRPTCLLAGGETTVTLTGNGKGGRNQEFALAAALAINGRNDIVILAAGTDGTDGPTDAAGAIVDGGSVDRGREAGQLATFHLDNNDSYPFHRATGDLLITGPTRTNVMDIYLALVTPEN